MIISENEFKPKYKYDMSRFPEPDKVLFFDIETTGLSPKRSMIYLIGCVYLSGDKWYARQWFSDSEAAEREVISDFFSFASRCHTLVHFNGDTFDIPFLNERAALHGIPLPENMPESFDIYRHTKSLKRLLSLPDCRQKTLEHLLGIYREDIYNGGELIDFYYRYLETKNESLYDAFMLHNAEDVEALPALPALLAYGEFFSSRFEHADERIDTCEDENGCVRSELCVTCRTDAISLPTPCSFVAEGCEFSCHDDELSFRIPIYNGQLRYFFKNFQDYYYLPDEDMAVHKSIAVYVDKDHRKKATASTCYQNHTGYFIPVPAKAAKGLQLFYRDYKKPPAYVEYKEGLWSDDEFLNRFLKIIKA